MSLMELFANPETIGTLSFGEKMTASFLTMCLGLGITFLVLILIWVFILLMGKALNAGEAKATKPSANKATPAAPAPTQAPAPTPVQATPIPTVAAPATVPKGCKDEELAAVIAAAIAAYEDEMGSSNTGRLVVRRITRVVGNTAPWLTPTAKTSPEIRM